MAAPPVGGARPGLRILRGCWTRAAGAHCHVLSVARLLEHEGGDPVDHILSYRSRLEVLAGAWLPLAVDEEVVEVHARIARSVGKIRMSL